MKKHKRDSTSTTNHPRIKPIGNRVHIIIRLSRGLSHSGSTLTQVAEDEGLSMLKKFLAANPGFTARRVIRHADPEDLKQKEKEASQRGFAPIRTLTAYWRIGLGEHKDPEKVRSQLIALPEIELAYIETRLVEASTASTSASANPYLVDQNYLDEAPTGIGATWVWNNKNVRGEGVRVADLEAGWILDHEDLPEPKLIWGDNGRDHGYVSGDHGAAAMGVVAGVDNELGIIGIAPGVETLDAISYYYANDDEDLHVADGIIAAIFNLNAGDVLFLEVQRYVNQTAYPTEIDSADFHAIRLATAHGLVVVEAAGNGEANLDDWQHEHSSRTLDPTKEGFVDSGAIMVGSAKSSVETQSDGQQGHQRYYTSNHGGRVDVYAWGQHICTTGYGELSGQPSGVHSYTEDFGQTSGATAIIAGAAALTQSWHKSVRCSELSCSAMRDLLSNPETGVPQTNLNGDPIGVMPNLAAIIQ